MAAGSMPATPRTATVSRKHCRSPANKKKSMPKTKSAYAGRCVIPRLSLRAALPIFDPRARSWMVRICATKSRNATARNNSVAERGRELPTEAKASS